MAWIHHTRAQYRGQLVHNHLIRRVQRKEQKDARKKPYLDRPYQRNNADNANEGDNGTLNTTELPKENNHGTIWRSSTRWRHSPHH